MMIIEIYFHWEKEWATIIKAISCPPPPSNYIAIYTHTFIQNTHTYYAEIIIRVKYMTNIGLM